MPPQICEHSHIDLPTITVMVLNAGFQCGLLVRGQLINYKLQAGLKKSSLWKAVL